MLDAVDFGTVFARKAVVMKSVLHFLRGAYRGAMRIAMEGRHQIHVVPNVVGSSLCCCQGCSCTDLERVATSLRPN